MFTVKILKAFQDNYIFILVDEDRKAAVVVDPGEADPVLDYLDQHHLCLEKILITHHHPDHVGGNLALKAATGCEIYGYGPDAARLPGLDHKLNAGESVSFGDQKAEVVFAPGHTLGHILYHFKESQQVFVGDTLFSLGCGRLFEGTPDQMWQSLQSFLILPDETKIYCAHEYTLANGRFAETLVGEDPELQSYIDLCIEKQGRGMPTIPTTAGIEKRLNPFFGSGKGRVSKKNRS